MLKYLRLTRAHTAPLEAVPAIIGAALATGTVWSKSVALWGIAGLLYHLAGYGHNSVADWIAGFDKDDPYKQHHPLNKGTISPRAASLFVKILLLVTVLFVAVLAYPNPGATLVLVFGLVAGLAYNIIGKYTKFKFVFISIAHTTIFVIPYIAEGGALSSPVFTLAALYVFTWIVFQISVSGEVKDFAQDESNFLKYLGSYMERAPAMIDEREVIFSPYSRHYAYSMKLLNVLAGITLAAVLDARLGVLLLLLVGSMITMNITIDMLADGPWNRQRRVTQMSLIEMMTAVMFVLTVWSVIGPAAGGLLVFGSVTWALLGNKILWGTVVGPKV